MNTIYIIARQIATQYPVFPCNMEKRPLVLGGFKSATQDEARIIDIFNNPAAALIGVPTGARTGLVAIDIDPRHGGLTWYNEHQADLPETRIHRTMSGGMHLLYRHPGFEVRNSAGRLGDGVDVRGDGGYIIWPGSKGYEVAHDVDIADLPSWLLGALRQPLERKPEATPYQPVLIEGGGSRYGLTALARACENIATAPDGAKHDTLNREAYAIGGLVGGGHLDEATARQALAGALNALLPRCEDEVAAKRTLAEAFRAGITKPRQVPEAPHLRLVEPNASTEGSDDFAPFQESGKPARQGLPLTHFGDIRPNLDAADFVEGLLVEGAMSVIYGPSNCGKTFFVSDLALHVATGTPWNGREVDRGGVIYCALEGAFGISNRVAAWREHYKPTETPAFWAMTTGINLLDPNADASKLIEAIKHCARQASTPVKLVIIDTLSRALAGGNENAPDDMGSLVSNLDRIRQATGAHIAAVHHSGKDTAKGARGHSLLRAATDTEIEITRENATSPSVAEVTKQRDLEIDGRWQFSLSTITLGTNRRGKPVTSCVVAYDAEAGPKGKPKPKLNGHEKLAIECLEEALSSFGMLGIDPLPRVKVVDVQHWRNKWMFRTPVEGNDAKRTTWNRTKTSLHDKMIARSMGDKAWLIQEDSSISTGGEDFDDA